MDRDLRCNGVWVHLSLPNASRIIGSRSRDVATSTHEIVGPSRNRKSKGKRERSKLSRSRSGEAASPFHRAVSRFRALIWYRKGDYFFFQPCGFPPSAIPELGLSVFFYSPRIYYSYSYYFLLSRERAGKERNVLLEFPGSRSLIPRELLLQVSLKTRKGYLSDENSCGDIACVGVAISTFANLRANGIILVKVFPLRTFVSFSRNHLIHISTF